MDYFNYHRRKSSVTRIGNTPLGGENPVRIQSMTNTHTQETLPCVEQSIRIIDAGADYVRLTAQGTKEAENLANIEKELHKRGSIRTLQTLPHESLRKSVSTRETSLTVPGHSFTSNIPMKNMQKK